MKVPIIAESLWPSRIQGFFTVQSFFKVFTRFFQGSRFFIVQGIYTVLVLFKKFI